MSNSNLIIQHVIMVFMEVAVLRNVLLTVIYHHVTIFLENALEVARTDGWDLIVQMVSVSVLSFIVLKYEREKRKNK